MGIQQSEEGLRPDPVTAAPEIAVGAIPSPNISPCAQPSPPDWQADSQIWHRRDRLLETTARVANVLLTLENFDEAIHTALTLLLEGTGCDRIKVLENSFDASSSLPKHSTIIYESVKPGILRQMSHPESRRTSNQGIEAFLERYFVNGNGFSGPLEEWIEPLRSAMAGFQVQSSCSVPIWVNGQWWGVLVLNYCREVIQVSPAEISVVRTIADCIGSAIQHDRLKYKHQKATHKRVADLEEYNRILQGRDRLLEVTARAANVLLTVDNINVAIDSALTVLIEGIGCDRLEILENVYDSSSPMPIRYRNTIHKYQDPKFEISPTDIEPAAAAELRDSFKKYFLEMDGFGGPLEEWDEPLSSWLATLHIQSTYAVPIRVKGQWWGILCFDYCRAPIRFSPSEVAVLRTTADCIGSAIQRDRLQQERQQVSRQRTADLEAYNRVLQGRDRLFEATAKVANILLTVENFDEAINTALGMFLEWAGCDRISILENICESSSPLPVCYKFIYEWATPSYSIRSIESNLICISSEAIGKDFLERYFLLGEGFGGLLEEWDDPLRSSLAAAQVKSSYSVPIRVNGQWWGLLSFDYCRAAIQISPAEIAVLKTIADCIGSAIQRDRTQREREQIALQKAEDLEAYNQVLQGRDRLFEATAKAANVLLTLENFDQAVNTALQLIGEGIGCDYVVVLENMAQPSSPLPSSCDFLYEWAAPGFLPLSVTFGSTSLPAELLGLDFMRQYFLEGNGFGGLTEVWNEPFRSALASVQVQSTYAVPIRVNGQWWGVLSLDYCQVPIQVSAAEISVLMAIADCIGSAIQRDRTQQALLEAEQNRSAELVKVNTAMRRSIDWLAQETDMNAFLGYLLEELAIQVEAQDAMIFLYDAQTRTLQTSVSMIDDEITFSPPFTKTFSVDEWPGWNVLLKSLKPLPFDLDTEPHLCLPEYREYHRRRKNQGIVCTLLQQAEEPLGFIGFGRPRKTFSEDELELVQSLTQQATLAIQLTRLAEEAQQAALLQERARMAREIHDTLAQAFGGIAIQLQAATYFADTQPKKAQLHLLTAQKLAKDGLAEARRSVWTLYLETSEYEDLAQTIAKFIEQTVSGQSVQIKLTIDGIPYRLHPDVGLNLLRIAQESMTNALRHAHAQIIQIYLSYSPETLKLTIHDNGRGFEPRSPSSGFGLLGMQQRAARIGATWQLVSQLGQGTTLTVTIANPTIP